MTRHLRRGGALALAIGLCLAFGGGTPSPLAAPAPLLVRGVQLLSGDIEPLLVSILGQLTLGGEPIPGTMFTLLSHEKQAEDIRFFFGQGLIERIRAERGTVIRQSLEQGFLAELGIDENDMGVLADGVELVFIRGARRIAVIQLEAGELRLGHPITLLKSGEVSPLPTLLGPKNPGEAAVAFF